MIAQSQHGAEYNRLQTRAMEAQARGDTSGALAAMQRAVGRCCVCVRVCVCVCVFVCRLNPLSPSTIAPPPHSHTPMPHPCHALPPPPMCTWPMAFAPFVQRWSQCPHVATRSLLALRAGPVWMVHLTPPHTFVASNLSNHLPFPPPPPVQVELLPGDEAGAYNMACA
jgi:hypothetical protein